MKVLDLGWEEEKVKEILQKGEIIAEDEGMDWDCVSLINGNELIIGYCNDADGWEFYIYNLEELEDKEELVEHLSIDIKNNYWRYVAIKTLCWLYENGRI